MLKVLLQTQRGLIISELLHCSDMCMGKTKQMLGETYTVTPEIIPTISYTCMNYSLDRDGNTDNCESIFNQAQTLSPDEGKICLHYYCTGASLFVWAGFHHTYSKWQKGKLILLYLLWIIDRVQSPWTAISFLSPPDCRTLLSFPFSFWKDGESILGEALY